MFEFLEVLAVGCGVSFQDGGRPGWKRFGVPPGGAMDPVAAGEANGLVGNGSGAVVVELVLQGARFRVIRDGWLGVAGASMGWPSGTARRVRSGEVLRFDRPEAGVYAYLAAPGGWVAPRVLGSAAVSARSGLGQVMTCGDVLLCLGDPDPPSWSGVAVRRGWAEDYPDRISVPVWRGPHWEEFGPEAQAQFLAAEWTVSACSDRMGVRLEGDVLEAPAPFMLSEPVLAGAVQVTGAGQPLVTMRDGPTVGGYPSIVWLDDNASRRLAQVPPGGKVRFLLVTDEDE